MAVAIIFAGSVHAAEPRFDSWHLRHPVMTGVVSGLTLGLVPERFGADTVEVGPYMEKGWTKPTMDLLRPHAEKSYKNIKTIISILEVLLALVLATRYYARKRR